MVDEVNVQNRWTPSTDYGPHREGRFVTIIGEDGVRYLGGHLDTVGAEIRPGLKVKAGQAIGTVGNSGNARDTAPNLYFAISWKAGPGYWWVRRGMVKPWDYLDAWLKGNKTLSPRAATFALRRKVGEAPGCAIMCAGRAPVPATPEPTRGRPKPQPSETPPFQLNATAAPD